MIGEFLLNMLITPIISLLGMLPTVDFDFLQSWDYIRETIVSIVAGVGCLLPIEEFMPLVNFQMGLWMFKLTYAIILRIKSFLPMWGGT